MNLPWLKKRQCEFCGNIGVEGVIAGLREGFLRSICRKCLQVNYNGGKLVVRFHHERCTCKNRKGYVKIPCEKCGATPVPAPKDKQ